MRTIDSIYLTKDMIGDLFETREGKIVRLEDCMYEDTVKYPAIFSDARRTLSGRFFNLGVYIRDVIKHLPRSEYPEYYL